MCLYDDWACRGCKKLIILNVPPQTYLVEKVIVRTALIEASPFERGEFGWYDDKYI